jgi:RNA polymerase sigma-B factor
MYYAPDEVSRERDARLLIAYAEDPSRSRLEQLVERYQPLARSLAQRYRASREPFEDLVQVADLGLVKAIKGFDPDRNTSFTAYAVPTILGELRRHFRDRVWNLRLPRGLQESSMKVEGSIDRLTGRLGRSPTVAELAEETELSIERINETLVARDVRWTSSMEAPGRTDDGESGIAPADSIGGIDPGYDRVEANVALTSAALDERERTMVELRFEDGLTQAEIGSRLGVSQMQVSRVSRRGLNKLLTAVRGDEWSPAGSPQ